MRLKRFLELFVLLLFVGGSAFAQGVVTGQLTGTITSDRAALPGATITVSSPSLQGTRTAYSDANGNYNFGALPPGEYTVRIEMSGLQTVTQRTLVTLGGTARVDADLKVSALAEAITVTATAPAVLETNEVEVNYQKEQIDNMPVGRTVTAIALLSPGVTNNGPRNAIQISGAVASDNLIMVNGAIVQENLRGQARPLFIEDAIQETTVISGAVSAEYGRFTGGVISSITKSGGNEFSASIRDSLDDPTWTEPSEFGEPEPESKLNHTYEGTFGGRIIRDRLWFFTAGRLAETEVVGSNVRLTGANIINVNENERYEIKLTGALTPNHTFVGNYLDNPFSQTNNNQFGVYEMRALDPSIEQEEDFMAAHYNGIFSSNLLGEVHWSERRFTFVGFGGFNRDPYLGTPLVQIAGPDGAANAPYFCGVCDDETRDNKLLTAKLSYFLGTGTLGTHNLVAGFEDYNEVRVSNNYQSPTLLTVWIYQVPARLENGVPIFTWSPGDTVEYYPVVFPSLGSDIEIQSLFLNDKWDLNEHFSFNLGLRYDQTKAVDSQGNPAADDSDMSPRLGVIYDPVGNGRFRVNGSYSKYIGRLAETVAGAGSAAGDPWGVYYYYDGEPVVGTSDQVVRAAIDWFNARGGTDFVANPPDALNIGGFSTRLAADQLIAPNVDEWTIGAGFQLSPNAYIRADYIDREWNDFYVNITNLQTGQVVEPTTGAEADLTIVDNTRLLERTYQGIQLQAQFRVFDRLNFGGNYTWSELQGNIEGENVGSGPISEGGWIFQYPEFQGFPQNRPIGFLSGDQEHKLRIWGSLDVPLGPAGTLNFSVLERFDSGRPYSIAGNLFPRRDPATGTDPLPYHEVPATVTYYFGERGELRWDDIEATDVAVNYRLPISRFQIFVEGEVINVFNQQGQLGGNLAITTATSSARNCRDAAGTAIRCLAFNPFTETPVEGTHYAIPSTFATPTSAADFQTPRTYRVSFGARF